MTLFPEGEQIEYVASRLEELRTIKIESNGVPGQEIENN